MRRLRPARSAAGRPGGLRGARGRPARARAYRLRGRIPAPQRHGGGAARPPLGVADAAVRLRGSADRPAARSLRARPRARRDPAAMATAPAREPRMWRPRAGPPLRMLRGPAGRPAAFPEVRGRDSPRSTVPGVRPRASPMGSSRRLSPAPERDTNKYLFDNIERDRGLCSVIGCWLSTPSIQKILPDF